MTAMRDQETTVKPEDVGERAQWLDLRRAARHGRLKYEGDQLLQQIHQRHPEWVAEWDLDRGDW